MSVREGGRVARTAYEVVDTYREPEVARLVCRLETGRTHQIRVHLQAIGHPVVGDAAYGGQRRRASCSTARSSTPVASRSRTRSPASRWRWRSRSRPSCPPCSTDPLAGLTTSARLDGGATASGRQSSASGPSRGVVTTSRGRGAARRRRHHTVVVVEASDGGVRFGLAHQPEVGADRDGGRERGHAQRPGGRHQLASLHAPPPGRASPPPPYRPVAAAGEGVVTHDRFPRCGRADHAGVKGSTGMSKQLAGRRPWPPDQERAADTMRVLIVEDDDAIATPLAKGLEREGLDGRPGRDRHRRARPQRVRVVRRRAARPRACPTATASTCVASCGPARTCRSSW